MPRPRTNVLFELNGQWIGTVTGTQALYRFWDDAGIERTNRQSLGTTDLEEAKLKLAEIIVKGPEQSPGSMLPIILEKYFTEKTDKKPSAGVSRSAGRMMLVSGGTERAWGH